MASLQNGSLIEVVDFYEPNPAEVAAAGAYLDAMYAIRQAYWLGFYQSRLQCFGFTR